MSRADKSGIEAKFLAIILALFIVLLVISPAFAAPTGVSITSNRTEAPNETIASSLTTAGGTFTTMVLNGTFQNPRWKAYVGNVTGVLTLDDTNGYTIYDWNLTSISGEVYVSRNSSISWSNINCSSTSLISSEQQFLKFNVSSVDNINKTFNTTSHKSFYTGTRYMSNSTCRSIATYINDTRQGASETAKFQEVLLSDTSSIIYAVLLEDSTLGFDNGIYDFQLIVPEDDTKVTPTPYYFYAEIS
ncbi:MAG: hypothetical protein ACP5N2_06225 [Candidatus Nanoarchaeia archaeon]